MIEFMFMMPILFMLLFMQLDIAFLVYSQATLLQAVREGVRFGVTNPSGTSCSGGSVQTCVKNAVVTAANGLLSGAAGNDITKVVVKCYAYNPSATPPGLYEVSSSFTTVAYNAGGNVMVVSVTGYNAPLLLPIFGYLTGSGGTGSVMIGSVNTSAMTFSVSAADRIEPISNPPAW